MSSSIADSRKRRSPPHVPLLVSILFAAACSSGCQTVGAPPNVILILVDTTRADRMSLYGYERDTTPHLRALASSAVVFDAARSQTACTFASVNSILTARYPSTFLDQPFGSFAIPAETPPLAQILKEHGYATYAVSASSVVRATPSKVNKGGGYQRGFDVFDESCENLPAACVNARGLALAARSGQPFFAYLHYIDPHHPYFPPVPFRYHFAKPIVADERVERGDPTHILASMYKKNETHDWSREVEFLSASYDDEIRYFDSELDELLAGIRAASDGRDTIVVLTADHGEDFLEHGDLMHCRTVYETSIHVPLVMWLPGVGGTRVKNAVQVLDIAPTLLDYLRIDASKYGFEGHSLRAVIEGGASPEQTFAMQSSFRTLIEGSNKLIYDLESGQGRLFDVAKDPGEENDLAASRPEIARALEKRILDRVATSEGGGDTHRAEQVSRQVQDRLRSLGYLQ